MQSDQAHWLRRDELIRLDGNVAGRIISCREGVLWLTQTGNPGDHLIRAGEAFSIGHRGVALISALEDSVFAVRDGRDNFLSSGRSIRTALQIMAQRMKGVLREILLT